MCDNPEQATACETALPQPATENVRRTDPGLSANLRADYEAVQNDLEQATEMAAEFQRQLAGKSNEVAELKQLFEKTQKDLVHLQAGIMALRQERHNLANDAMRAVALEHRLNAATTERDRLRSEVDAMRQGLATGADEMARRTREYNVQVARLTVEIETLKQRGGRSMPGSRTADPAVRDALLDISRSVENVLSMIDSAPASRTPPQPKTRAAERADEFIDISFSE
jgi:DNA repair ATPase RecN